MIDVNVLRLDVTVFWLRIVEERGVLIIDTAHIGRETEIGDVTIKSMRMLNEFVHHVLQLKIVAHNGWTSSLHL